MVNFNSHQLELKNWFKSHAASLGELYEGALAMLYIDTFPGRTRLVSHCVREIRNRLPDIIVGTVTKKSKFNLNNQLEDLMKDWLKAGFSYKKTDGAFATAQETSTFDITMPQPLVDKTTLFFKEYVETKETNKEAALRLFAGCSPCHTDEIDSLRPQAIQWFEVTEWFMKLAHDGGKQDQEIDIQEFRKKFELFEVSLGALLRGFFKTKGSLDEILEETNS